MRFSILVCISLLLTACAMPMTKQATIQDETVQREVKIQKELAVKSFIEATKRLDRVSYPLLKSSVQQCKKDVRWDHGALLLAEEQIGNEFREAAVSVYGLSKHPRVIQVVDGTSAQSARLQIGDELMAINGEPTATEENAVEKSYARVKELAEAAEPIVFKVMREDKIIHTSIKPEKVCSYPMYVNTHDAINAYADGENVVIFKGMMRFTETDEELAMVVAHEIAHNIMHHVRSKKTNSILGALTDALVSFKLGVGSTGLFQKMGAKAHSQNFEAEADYVGLYILANTGVEYVETPGFWRRMAAEHPSSIKGSYGTTHPSTSERFVKMEATVKEIQQKQVAGEPLQPNKKFFAQDSKENVATSE